MKTCPQWLLQTPDWKKNYLKDIKSYSNSYVTFGHGAKGKIMGKWKLDYYGISCLSDVLIIKDLIANSKL